MAMIILMFLQVRLLIAVRGMEEFSSVLKLNVGRSVCVASSRFSITNNTCKHFGTHQGFPPLQVIKVLSVKVTTF